MTINVLTSAPSELESDVLKEPESAPQEEALLEIELAAEDLEIKEPANEVSGDDNQEVDDDPVRLYLHADCHQPPLALVYAGAPDQFPA